MSRSGLTRFLMTLAALVGAPTFAAADEGGVSFWLPGFFGSLAAVPQQPGFSLASIYWHDSVTGGADLARALDIRTGRIPVSLNVGLSADLKSQIDVGIFDGTYAFATPILGGQLTLGLMSIYGRQATSLSAALAGTITTPLGTLPFSRGDSISDSVTGFGDLYPQIIMRWNAGVNNYMAYVTGDVPVGAYDSTRLSNIGIGHGAVDAGFGYTYFDQKTGHEFSGVLGFTANMTNHSTQYQNGVDLHFDWGTSQFLTKQFQVGLVGYVYDEIGCDSGSGDRVGCFKSRVVGVGPQVGFIIPVSTTTQAYLNLKGYREFDNANRPDGWNTWLTLVLSPAQQTPPSAARRMRSM